MRTLILISICRASLLCNTIFVYECLEWSIIFFHYFKSLLGLCSKLFEFWPLPLQIVFSLITLPAQKNAQILRLKAKFILRNVLFGRWSKWCLYDMPSEKIWLTWSDEMSRLRLTYTYLHVCESRAVFCLGRIRNFQVPRHNLCYHMSGVWRYLRQWFALLITAQYKSCASPCEISKSFYGVWKLNC